MEVEPVDAVAGRVDFLTNREAYIGSRRDLRQETAEGSMGRLLEHFGREVGNIAQLASPAGNGT